MFRHASLNRIYRLVWSEARNAYVAVAETSRARGKRSSSVVGAVGALALGALSSSGAQAAAPTTVVPTGGNTAAYIAPNGVPVVDINTANAAGVSHNQYWKYNVDNKGLVLNNGNTDQMARQSQLAGQVMANSNLAKQATLILNEVVAPNRSQLSGFTEVLGGKADVVVANPYGITCSGCGFINTDRVTLTTGVPVLNGNGALNGFRVTGGDLLINGSGLNASAQQILDLVARSIKIDGQVNANDLSLTAGANSWDYGSRATTGALTPTDALPAYAIDSTVLGGMYANRIKIVATEAGVGVRMLGEAAATASDFNLDASGKIIIQSKLSAARDIQIASTASDADALALLDSSITAQRNLDLSALLGGAALNGGALLANNNFTLNVGSLSDAATASALADNNKRFAGAGLHIHATGSVDLNGVSYGSGTALNVEADNLTIGADGATLFSATTLDVNSAHNLTLANAALKSAGAMHLTAQAGDLTTGSGAGQGIQASSGDVVVNANGMTNGGTISADAGALTLRVDDLSNGGTLHSAQLLSIADQSGDGGENIANTGALISAAGLDIIAHNITNSGSLQAATGSTVNADSLTNSGTWIGSTADAASVNFYLQDLTNSGTLQSAHDLNLTLLNALTNSGKILAAHDLSIEAASSGATLTVSNQNNGVLQASNLLQLQGTAGAHNLALTTQADSIAQGKRLNLIIASLSNAGKLQGHANGTNLDVTGTLNNSGALLSDTTLDILADTILNSGTVQSALASTTTANSLTNSGTWIGSTTAGYSSSFNANSLTNTGTLQSAQDLSLTVLNAIDNSGTVSADRDLLIEAKNAGTTLAVNNQGSGILQAANLLQVRGTAGAGNATLSTQAASKIFADHHMNLLLASLTNAGLMQGGSAASTIAVSGTLTNSSGAKLLLNSGGGTVSANVLTNAGNLESKGATAINIGSTLTNTGTLLSTGALTARGTSASAYSISDSGRLESSGLLDIKGYGGSDAVNVTVGPAGILRGASMDLDAKTLSVGDNGSSGGIVNTTGAMTLVIDTLTFGGSHSRIVAATGGGNANITLTNSFSNPGAIFSGGNLTFNLPSLTNTSTGGISALDTLTIHATAGDLYNAGALYAGNLLTASSTGTFTNYADNSGFIGTIDSSGSMNLSALTFINNSSINASQNITVSATTFRNEVPGGDTRTWGAYSTKTHTQTGYDSQGYNGHGCCDQYETWYYTDTWYRDQYYAGGTPLFKPQLIAGNTLTIKDFTTGTNIGGVISGHTVNITGAGVGATFTNNDLTLLRENSTETYTQEIKYIAAGPAQYYNDFDDGTHRGSTTTTANATLTSFGAGIFANNGQLNATGFSLVNAGNPLSASVATKSESGVGAGTTTSGGSRVFGATPIGGVNPVTGAATIAFGGLTITLPANPNGYFVTNKDPGAQYLVETNPLFAVGSNVVGSNYLADRYGYSPDVVTKRLGDANYEAFLLKQQLIQQLGTNLIKGYDSEAAQMQGLMDNAVTEGKRLGFAFGKPPSAEQLANLKEDVMWMVETVVAGQKVLTPVVYLSNATKANYEAGGAVIAGSTVNMNLESLTNTGGTISGDNKLNITTKGDITNTSGTIKGGDVQLASAEGSIVNQTYVSTSGDASSSQVTTVGKQAGIQATGNLSVDAAKDITNLGANMSAGGDASLSAGGNVTFDTVENKNANTTHTSSSNGLANTSTSTTVATTEQIKSGLTSGGNLTVKSKNDITFAGTDVKAGGDADIDATGNVNLLARANTTTTTTKTTTEGLGVGGGLGGMETTDTDDFHSRNVGSTLDVGGNAKLNAGKDLTLEGSKADIKGNADINATNVNILAGKDLDRSTSTTTTTTFLKVDTGSSDSSSGSQSGSSASSGDGAAGAEASAGAQAEANAQGGVKFAETTSTHKETVDQTSVGSSLNVGGNLNMKATDTVKLTGSEINAGGDANIAAKDVKVLAAQDIHTSSESTSVTSVGLMASSNNNASANASADANADSNNMDARANANAKAEASNNNDVTLMSTSTTTTDSLEINNKGSAIKSGGNMSIDASNKLTTQGATVESGGDMTLKAKDMENLAATDVKTTTTTSDTTTVGLYNENKASAEANATAGANGIGMTTADASADASASASAEVGIKAQNTQTSNTDGSTTAITSSFKSGGNMTRTAENKITDVGTQIEAGGDFTQSATTIDSKAAKNTTFSSSSSETNTAKLGIYAEANASAGASADSSGETKAEAGANVGAGVHASYENQKDSSSSNSSTAVVSNIKAGGNINSTSKGKTSLEGTNLTSGGDTNLDAGSLDYKAAQNTSSSSSSSSNINADVKAGIQRGTDGAAKLDVAGGYGEQKSSDASTTAVTGSVNSGGKLNIKTKDDAHFEGTQLNSAGDANVAAGGNVTFDAAKNTQTSSAEGFDVSASLSLSKSKSGDKEGSTGIEGGYNKSSSDASQAVVGGINSGGKLNVNAGKNATFEGTNIASAGDANISAKDNLAFNAAHDTSSSQSLNIDASLSATGSKGKNEETGGTKSSKGAGLDASADYSKDSSSTAKVGSISSGGNLKLNSGKDTTLEGTQVDASGAAKIDAGGNVNIKAAKSTSESLSVGGAIGGSVESNKENDSTGKQTKNEKTGSGDLSLALEGGKSSTATVASIKGGKGIDINAGKDATLEGTQLSSGGDTNIAAGGAVNLAAAQSTDIHGGIAGSLADGGAKLNKAEIGGGVENQTANIDTAGNLNIKSGGKTTLEGTQVTAGGNANIDAAGGVDKKTVVSGSGEIGLNKADASLDVQKTAIQSEGRTLVPMSAGSTFKSSVPIPANIPAGKKIEAATADGKPLPSWLSFDAKTGNFVGTPPADFKGNLNVVVKVPDANGGVTEIPLRFQGQ